VLKAGVVQIKKAEKVSFSFSLPLPTIFKYVILMILSCSIAVILSLHFCYTVVTLLLQLLSHCGNTITTLKLNFLYFSGVDCAGLEARARFHLYRDGYSHHYDTTVAPL
jgi:hypothetical protein